MPPGFAGGKGCTSASVPVSEAVGMALAHDITEIRAGEFKGRAFRKGHIVRPEDIEHLRRLGKENLFVISIGPEFMHEDEAACALAQAIAGDGVETSGPPREGKIDFVAGRDGLLKVNTKALCGLNMLGDVICASLHSGTVVRKGQKLGGTRAIPLVVRRSSVERAVGIAAGGILFVRPMRKPRAGVVITGGEVYYGRINDSFAPVIKKKIEGMGGSIAGLHYAPDDAQFIAERVKELLAAGADLIILTGGMSVDPDDVTRFAVRQIAYEVHYGTPVLPGAMFLVAYARVDGRDIPVVGMPACGMYHKVTVFDIVLPRLLAGEHIGRKELAALGHGGYCLSCTECRYPVCPFGK